MASLSAYVVYVISHVLVLRSLKLVYDGKITRALQSVLSFLPYTHACSKTPELKSKTEQRIMRKTFYLLFISSPAEITLSLRFVSLQTLFDCL